MKSKLITLFLLVSFCSVIYSQSNDLLAREKYIAAKTAFADNKYVNAVNLILEIQELLGGTNLRIQPLYIKSLAGANAWQFVKFQIERYEELNPDKTLVEYAEIMEISTKIEPELQKEELAYQNIKDSATVNACNDYLRYYKYGQYKDEVSWAKAKLLTSTSSYYKYVDAFPAGKFVEQAMQTIDRWDKSAYDKAISEGEIVSFEKYLSNYPRGKYVDNVKELITNKKDEDAYMGALNSNATTELEKYLSNFPNGKNVTQAKLTIEKWDNDAYNKAITAGDKNALRYYVINFPKGKYILEIKKKLQDKIDYEAFSKANNYNSLVDLEKYIIDFPNGNYVSEANSRLEDLYSQNGNQEYKKKNWLSAKVYYDKYQKQFPTGKYTTEITKKLKVTNKKIQYQNSKSKKVNDTLLNMLKTLGLFGVVFGIVGLIVGG